MDNTKELKSQLYESIENIDNQDFLQVVKDVLDQKYQPKEKIKLTTQQKRGIDNAKKSIDRGDFLTNDQANQLVTKWLNE